MSTGPSSKRGCWWAGGWPRRAVWSDH